MANNIVRIATIASQIRHTAKMLGDESPQYREYFPALFTSAINALPDTDTVLLDTTDAEEVWKEYGDEAVEHARNTDGVGAHARFEFVQ